MLPAACCCIMRLAKEATTSLHGGRLGKAGRDGDGKQDAAISVRPRWASAVSLQLAVGPPVSSTLSGNIG